MANYIHKYFNEFKNNEKFYIEDEENGKEIEISASTFFENNNINEKDFIEFILNDNVLIQIIGNLTNKEFYIYDIFNIFIKFYNDHNNLNIESPMDIPELLGEMLFHLYEEGIEEKYIQKIEENLIKSVKKYIKNNITKTKMLNIINK